MASETWPRTCLTWAMLAPAATSRVARVLRAWWLVWPGRSTCSLASQSLNATANVAGNLDGVVELADLGHVDPQPGPAQVLADAVEAEPDDLADPPPASQLDPPDVGDAVVARVA